VDNFSFRFAFLLSIDDSIEERDEIENEKENTPIIIRIMHIILSGGVKPVISPNPTVVIVVKVKYIEAI
jgi:hypothetical protein